MTRAPFGSRLSDDAVRLASRLSASLTPEQRIVLFTGTADGQRISAVAGQVALASANLIQERILLIDAATAEPTLHATFDVPPAPGLVEVLNRRHDFAAALSHKGADSLWILPRGGEADYIQLFGSAACKELLQAARASFRLVVVATSPILQSAATCILAAQSDGVVAVVAAGRDHKADVAEIKRVVDGLKVGLLGAVLATEAAPPGTRRRRRE